MTGKCNVYINKPTRTSRLFTNAFGTNAVGSHTIKMINSFQYSDYLGEKNDFNEQVLKAFVDLHDFSNLILVQALRQFLWSFRLPGEAQKIDRMMECFAQRYCQLNPDIFTNTDTCYVLSFAIIMLNTSLHNPSSNIDRQIGLTADEFGVDARFDHHFQHSLVLRNAGTLLQQLDHILQRLPIRPDENRPTNLPLQEQLCHGQYFDAQHYHRGGSITASSSWVRAIIIILFATGCWDVISSRIIFLSLVITILTIWSISMYSALTRFSIRFRPEFQTFDAIYTCSCGGGEFEESRNRPGVDICVVIAAPVKEKPTVEQFISMNRGINNGGDLPRELLESLYESIRTEPFKIPQDDGNDLMHTFFNPDKEGWLWKQGGRYKSWKRRWFILNDNCLYYFEYTTDKEPRGIIPLENIAVREVQDRSKQFCFELHASGGAEIIKACKTDSEGKVVEGKHTVYRMSAASEEEQREWIKCLNQSISHNPFHDILVQRKKKALAKM
ncbi:cytohesin 1, 2, 3, 4 [Culex quinquefasciatus]|uniref:Cytohesin 1, 2, 3, 4 n=1 Tax=Culex quinquefasciatus TaxID=7176 RepID=B0W300_CULQU|nr:cytohesin 1, 2, 3, 4 [Culex quinquefasciatus]|eukprot:XP_001843084.1 cytohesin 1, 2, 3, 4 [Culex quinquefasciatus]